MPVHSAGPSSELIRCVGSFAKPDRDTGRESCGTSCGRSTRAVDSGGVAGNRTGSRSCRRHSQGATRGERRRHVFCLGHGQVACGCARARAAPAAEIKICPGSRAQRDFRLIGEGCRTRRRTIDSRRAAGHTTAACSHECNTDSLDGNKRCAHGCGRINRHRTTHPGTRSAPALKQITLVRLCGERNLRAFGESGGACGWAADARGGADDLSLARRGSSHRKLK